MAPAASRMLAGALLRTLAWLALHGAACVDGRGAVPTTATGMSACAGVGSSGVHDVLVVVVFYACIGWEGIDHCILVHD